MSLLLFGMIVDYISTIKERNIHIRNQKIAKYVKSIVNGQRLLERRTALPVTMQCSIISLERSLRAFEKLIKLQSSQSRLEAMAAINAKLNSFKKSSPSPKNHYALLQVPSSKNEQVNMLKQCVRLKFFLKAEYDKGNISSEILQSETVPLEILNARLKAAIISAQAVEELGHQDYTKLQKLSDKAMQFLHDIQYDDNKVKALLAQEIEKIKLINVNIIDKTEEKIEEST